MSAQAGILSPGRDIASTRILRFAVGTGLAMFVSQAIAWDISFITPVLVSVFLTLPLPAPRLKGGIGFVLVLVGALIMGALFLPAILNQPGAGLALVIVALFITFFYGARGGSPILTTFLLMGILLVPGIGSESIDAVTALIQGMAICGVIAMLFVWLAYALFPDPPLPAPAAGKKPEKPMPPPISVSARSAFRSTAVVAPVLLWFLMATGTASYAAVLIKVATMGQEVSGEGTRAAGRSLVLSTIIGGLAAIVMWNVLRMWPSLIIYTLLTVLCALILGPRIFAAKGLTPDGPTWSYGFLTMIIILAPAVVDSQGGAAAGARFTDRIIMFLLATLYAVIAVFVFDQFWPTREDTDKTQTR